MTDHENTWDASLQIKTTGRDDTHSDAYRYPYEPTPYTVLERLAASGLVRQSDVILDYIADEDDLHYLMRVKK